MDGRRGPANPTTALARLERDLAVALRTIREDPSLTVTADGRVEAKPLLQLRRLFPELSGGDLDTVHREATDAAAAYTAEGHTPRHLDAARTALAATRVEAAA